MPGLGTIKLVQQCIGTGLKQQAGGVDLAHGSDHSLLSPEVDSSGSAAGHTSRLKEKVSTHATELVLERPGFSGRVITLLDNSSSHVAD